jgi:hypothetical protein
MRVQVTSTSTGVLSSVVAFDIKVPRTAQYSRKNNLPIWRLDRFKTSSQHHRRLTTTSRNLGHNSNMPLLVILIRSLNNSYVHSHASISDPCPCVLIGVAFGIFGHSIKGYVETKMVE